MRADLNGFWWTREQTWLTFVKFDVFFVGKKNPNSQKEISVVNSDLFLPKKITNFVLKVRRVGSQVHQKLPKSARILSGEKNLQFGTPIEIAT